MKKIEVFDDGSDEAKKVKDFLAEKNLDLEDYDICPAIDFAVSVENHSGSGGRIYVRTVNQAIGLIRDCI